MKKFLATFSALAASFGASANVASTPNTMPFTDDHNVQADRVHGLQGERLSAKDEAGNVFEFLLKRSGPGGELMAWHESHSSHASHSSHSSHASHYSSSD